MTKTKKGIFQVYYFASRTYSLASNAYLEYYIVYLALHSLVLLIYGLFQDFAPISMYGENEENCVIPT